MAGCEHRSRLVRGDEWGGIELVDYLALHHTKWFWKILVIFVIDTFIQCSYFIQFHGEISCEFFQRFVMLPRSSRSGKSLKRKWRHLALVLRRLQNFAETTEGGQGEVHGVGQGWIVTYEMGMLHRRKMEN